MVGGVDGGDEGDYLSEWVETQEMAMQVKRFIEGGRSLRAKTLRGFQTGGEVGWGRGGGGVGVGGGVQHLWGVWQQRGRGWRGCAWHDKVEKGLCGHEGFFERRFREDIRGSHYNG